MSASRDESMPKRADLPPPERRFRRAALAAAISIAIVWVLLHVALAISSTEPGPLTLSGDLDSLLLHPADGVPVRLEQLRNRAPVVIIFLAEWSPPCDVLRAVLESDPRQPGTRPRRILAFLGSASLDRIPQDQLGPGGIAVAVEGSALEELGLRKLPTAAFVDRYGDVLSIAEGLTPRIQGLVFARNREPSPADGGSVSVPMDLPESMSQPEDPDAKLPPEQLDDAVGEQGGALGDSERVP